jgi:hypothetical protein
MVYNKTNTIFLKSVNMSKIKLKKNQPYIPGKPSFARTRPFWKPFDIPSVFHADAYELSSIDPVTLVEVDRMGYVTGIFRDQHDKDFVMTWNSEGKPVIGQNHEFNRVLQNRADLKDKVTAHFNTLPSQV